MRRHCFCPLQGQFRTYAIQQSNPLAGQKNTITVSMAIVGIQRSLTNPTSIMISGLRGAAITGDTVAISAANAGNSAERLFCDKYGRPKYGDWINTTNTVKLRLCEYWTVDIGVAYAFSFDVVNPKLAQDSPPVNISATSGAGSDIISAVEMTTPGGDDPITAIGSDGLSMMIGSRTVLEVVSPSFVKRSIQQMAASPGVASRLSFTLQFNVNVDYVLTITVSGLNKDLVFTANSTGASWNNVNAIRPLILLPEDCGEGAEIIFCGSEGTPGTADWNSGNITLKLCSTQVIDAGSIYRFGIGIVNPSAVQAPPTLFIEASSSVQSFPRQSIIAPSSEAFNGIRDMLASIGLRDALRIEEAGFLLRQLSQINPVTSEDNTITVSLVSSSDISGANNQSIVISGLRGILAGDAYVNLDMPPEDPAGAQGGNVLRGGGLFCEDGNVEKPRRGFWKVATKTLTLRFCRNATMRSQQLYTVAFSFANGPYPQSSPNINISLTGQPLTFESRPVQKAAADAKGVVEGTSPLKLATKAEVSAECLGTENFLSCDLALQFPRGAYDYIVTVDMKNLDLSVYDVYFSSQMSIFGLDDDFNTRQYLNFLPVIQTMYWYWGNAYTYNINPQFSRQCGKVTGVIHDAGATASIEAQVKKNGYKMQVLLGGVNYYIPQGVCGAGAAEAVVKAKISVKYRINPLFGDAFVSQSNPVAGEQNTISLNFTILFLSQPLGNTSVIYVVLDSVSLKAQLAQLGTSDIEKLALSSPSGSVHSKFCSSDGAAGKAKWIKDASSLVLTPDPKESESILSLTLCEGETLDAFTSYVVSFGITNPDTPSDTPASAKISSDFGLGESSRDTVVMAYPGGMKGQTDNLALSGLADPMRIMSAGFMKTSMTQSNPFTSEANVLTLAMQMSVTVNASSVITLSGFDGKAIISSSVALFNVGSVLQDEEVSPRDFPGQF